MHLSWLQGVVFEICLAPVIDKFVVNMEVHIYVVELSISLFLDIELGDPVVRQVLSHVAGSALTVLQGIILSKLVKPASSYNSMDMSSRLNPREHDGVHALGGQDPAVHSPYIGFHAGQMN